MRGTCVPLRLNGDWFEQIDRGEDVGEFGDSFGRDFEDRLPTIVWIRKPHNVVVLLETIGEAGNDRRCHAARTSHFLHRASRVVIDECENHELNSRDAETETLELLFGLSSLGDVVKHLFLFRDRVHCHTHAYLL